MKNKGFTLAEILIVLFIGGILLITATHIAMKYAKIKTKPQQIVHGQYACTMINGTEYVAWWNGERNVVLPTLTSISNAALLANDNIWHRGACHANFTEDKIPQNITILSVQLFGGGGGGQNASAEWRGEPLTGLLTENGDTYTARLAGTYDVELYGQRGEDTFVEPWTISGYPESCKARPGLAGEHITVIGKIYLNKNDVLRFEKTPKTPGAAVQINGTAPAPYNVNCSSVAGATPNPPTVKVGRNGGNTALYRGATSIVSATGSQSGRIVCTPKSGGAVLNCTARFTTLDEIERYPLRGVGTTGPGFTLASKNYLTPIDGGAKISLSSANMIREFIPKGGCGGRSGATNAMLYSFIERVIPAIITVGPGGLSNQTGGNTRFGPIVALGGTPELCPLASDTPAVDRNGTDGGTLADLPMLRNIQRTIGRGGIGVNFVSTVNGGNGGGIASGGGGGGVSYNIAVPPVYNISQSEAWNRQPQGRWGQGTGGTGAPGAIIITW